MKNDPYFLFVKETFGDAKEESHRLLGEAAEAFFRKEGVKREEIFYTPLGKPYFPSEKFYLSVTHTGRLFAAVFSTFPIGIDGEKEQVKKDAVALRFFSEREREIPFSHVWTAKEAVAKIDGRGLSVMRQIEVFEDEALFQGKKYDLFRKSVGEYLITIALYLF